MIAFLVLVFIGRCSSITGDRGTLAANAMATKEMMQSGGTVLANQAGQAVKSKFFTFGGLATMGAAIGLSKAFDRTKSWKQAVMDGTGVTALQSTGKYLGKHAGAVAAGGLLVGGAYAASRYFSRNSIGEGTKEKEEALKKKTVETAKTTAAVAEKASGVWGTLKSVFSIFGR